MGYVIRMKRNSADPARYFNLERGTEVLDPSDATVFVEAHVFELARRMSAAEPDLPPVEPIKLEVAKRDFLGSFQGSSVGSDSKSGGCFVATVCCGSPNHREVIILKEFRDRILSRSKLGRRFISSYYSWGPALAARLGTSRSSNREVVRFVVVKPLALVATNLLRAFPASRKRI